eukprot:scaffold71379_cov34-Cyclotella_meneghiniana.AAC.1
MSEWYTTKTFSKNIAKLVMCINFNQSNIAWTNLFAKPMILNGIVFRARSHALWFQAAKC